MIRDQLPAIYWRTSGPMSNVVNCYISGWMVNISMCCFFRVYALVYTVCDISLLNQRNVRKHYLAPNVQIITYMYMQVH